MELFFPKVIKWQRWYHFRQFLFISFIYSMNVNNHVKHWPENVYCTGYFFSISIAKGFFELLLPVYTMVYWEPHVSIFKWNPFLDKTRFTLFLIPSCCWKDKYSKKGISHPFKKNPRQEKIKFHFVSYNWRRLLFSCVKEFKFEVPVQRFLFYNFDFGSVEGDRKSQL